MTLDLSYLNVMERRCSECLYSSARVVSDERAAELLARVAADDTFFVCHKATLAHTVAACRGWYDANPGSRPVRLAAAFGRLRLVTPAELEEP